MAQVKFFGPFKYTILIPCIILTGIIQSTTALSLTLNPSPKYLRSNVHFSVHQSVLPSSFRGHVTFAEQGKLSLSVKNSMVEGAHEGVVVLVLQHSWGDDIKLFTAVIYECS
jgi:hypothetical protein